MRARGDGQERPEEAAHPLRRRRLLRGPRRREPARAAQERRAGGARVRHLRALRVPVDGRAVGRRVRVARLRVDRRAAARARGRAAAPGRASGLPPHRRRPQGLRGGAAADARVLAPGRPAGAAGFVDGFSDARARQPRAPDDAPRGDGRAARQRRRVHQGRRREGPRELPQGGRGRAAPLLGVVAHARPRGRRRRFRGGDGARGLRAQWAHAGPHVPGHRQGQGLRLPLLPRARAAEDVDRRPRGPPELGAPRRRLERQRRAGARGAAEAHRHGAAPPRRRVQRVGDRARPREPRGARETPEAGALRPRGRLPRGHRAVERRRRPGPDAGGAARELPRPRGPRARETSATCPTSKAPTSAVVRSFRPISGRAIIPRNGLGAWMLFTGRARAAHSRCSDVESP